ncbi:MAG TPA: VWA domain-containing protein, partial [Bryobacteraceae bacterium]|nr:VWA domain-containing protein [Bryobacteraceae bacterium]
MEALLRYIGLFAACCGLALAQEQPPRDQRRDTQQAPTFQSKVNLVLVAVVVRDAHGRPVGNLKKDDFQIFDKGKRQAISIFSAVERPKQGRENDRSTTLPARGLGRTVVSAPTKSDATVAPIGSNSPERYFIYLFDDLNTRFTDMANIRDAAIGHFKKNLSTGDRAAIYTFSSKPTLEFTSDREKLEDAVSKLRWRPRVGHEQMHCPDVNYYLADLVMAKNDSQALVALTYHTAACAHVRPEIARQMAMDAVNRELIVGAEDTQIALGTIRRAIRRLSGMPGQRILALSSPGFFAQTPEGVRATAEVIDFAAKSNVIISGLSVRGVILAEEEQDVAASGSSPRRTRPGVQPSQLWQEYRRESARANGDVLKDLAEGTGGTFFRNNNDLRVGLERLSAAPEFSYVLGFSPHDLKADGSFHSLRVHLPDQKAVNVEARRGYYAIELDPKDKGAAEDMADAVFARDEVMDIPVVLQTGYTKPHASDAAKVLLAAKIDLTPLHYQRALGRNLDSLSVVAALFDSEGGY